MKKVGLIKDIKLKEEVPLVEVKFTHSLCIGQTGSGKTTSFIYPNIKKRMELDHGILFFDIKGSEHLALKKLADDVGRLDDIIEIGKPWGANINIIESFNSRTFEQLLKAVVGNPAEGGSNTYFYNEAISLGLNLYNIFKLKSIISQEIKELDAEALYQDLQNDEFFALDDLYNTIYNIDTLYEFIQETKKFIEDLHSFFTQNFDIYYSENIETYKNIVLNYANLKSTLSFFKKYDVEKGARSDNEKFETSLLSVISTLSSGFNFMGSAAAKYVSQKEDPLNIVQALQEKKIIIINVRVIPDMILELMLEQIFELMIDLNLQNEDEKQPISVFIDEAQRLINKDIPLDVLRSSKVDVLMAVQSELQLISKFNSREDWQQISVNIAQKYAFKSIYFGTDQLLSFYIDTATLNTFEYVKEYEERKYRASPIFLSKDELPIVEYKYQKEVLKLEEINKDEILFYDVTHFENEREVILINTKTKKKKYKKIFTEFQENIINKELKDYIKQPMEKMLESSMVKGIIPEDRYKIMYEKYNIWSKNRLNNSAKVFDSVMEFETIDDLFSALYRISLNDPEYEKSAYIYDLFNSLSSDEYEDELLIFSNFDTNIIETHTSKVVEVLIEFLAEEGIFIFLTKDDSYRLYLMHELSAIGKEIITEHIDDLSF